MHAEKFILRGRRFVFTDVLKHPVTVGLFYFSIIGFSLIYDEVSDSIDSDVVIAVTLLLMIIFIVILVLTNVVFYFTRNKEVEDHVRDLKNFISAQQMGWIVNDKYIRSIEFGSEHTWVFTRNLSNDLDENGEIFQSVSSNLKSGKLYTYYLPQEPYAYQAMRQYCRMHQFKEGQVSFYLIPKDRYLFYTEVVVYNVHSEGRIAIEWLPLNLKSLDDSEKPSQFYIQMDLKHTDFIVGIGEMFKSQFDSYSIKDY